jgi:hypothetical protein
MTGSPRSKLSLLGHMLAQQARLMKAEGMSEAQKLADRAGNYLNLARSYPLHEPVQMRVRSDR